MPSHLRAADAPEDLWRCHECGWTYPNHHPSAKHRRNHKKLCGKLPGFTTVRDLDKPETPLSHHSHVASGSSNDASSDDEHHHRAHKNNHHKQKDASTPPPPGTADGADGAQVVFALNASNETLSSPRTLGFSQLKPGAKKLNGSHQGSRSLRSAHAVEGQWICQHCGWTYPNAHPSAKNRRKHKKKCGAAGAHVGNGGSSEDASSQSSEEDQHQNNDGLAKNSESTVAAKTGEKLDEVHSNALRSLVPPTCEADVGHAVKSLDPHSKEAEPFALILQTPPTAEPQAGSIYASVGASEFLLFSSEEQRGVVGRPAGLIEEEELRKPSQESRPVNVENQTISPGNQQESIKEITDVQELPQKSNLMVSQIAVCGETGSESGSAQWQLRSMKSLIQEVHPHQVVPLRLDSSDPHSLMVLGPMNDDTGTPEQRKSSSHALQLAAVGTEKASCGTEERMQQIQDTNGSDNPLVAVKYINQTVEIQEPEKNTSGLTKVVADGGVVADGKDDEAIQTLDSHSLQEPQVSTEWQLRSMKSILQDPSIPQMVLLGEGKSSNSSVPVVAVVDQQDVDAITTEELPGAKNSSDLLNQGISKLETVRPRSQVPLTHKNASFGDWIPRPPVKNPQSKSAEQAQIQRVRSPPESPEGLVRARVEKFEKLAGSDTKNRRKSMSPTLSSSPQTFGTDHLRKHGPAERTSIDLNAIPKDLQETISHLRHQQFSNERRSIAASEHEAPPELFEVMSHLRHRHNAQRKGFTDDGHKSTGSIDPGCGPNNPFDKGWTEPEQEKSQHSFLPKDAQYCSSQVQFSDENCDKRPAPIKYNTFN